MKFQSKAVALVSLTLPRGLTRFPPRSFVIQLVAQGNCINNPQLHPNGFFTKIKDQGFVAPQAEVEADVVIKQHTRRNGQRRHDHRIGGGGPQ